MTKGDNGFVPSVPLRIAVRGGVDAMALLLTEHGAVRGDADVVFHGAPAHPTGTVRLTGAEHGTAWLEVTLTAVEPQIDRVLVVGSTEGGAMRDVAGLSVEAFAADGTPVARYDVTDAAGETAMVLAELYRRAGGWKFRAVGQGYANGLAGLATDHGVHVVSPETPQAPPVPVAPVAPAAPPRPAVPFAPPPPAATYPAPPAVFAPPPTKATYPAAPPPAFVPPPPPPPPISAPAPAAPPVTPFVPAPTPAQPPAPWSYGPVFPPYTQTGRDNDVLTVDGLPPGPVIVQLDVQGDGYTGLTVLDRRNKEGDNLINSTEDAYTGRVLAQVPGNGRLRFRLEADGPWRFEVTPLMTARHLTEHGAQFRGPDVLLHTGGVADLAIHYRGDSNLIVNLYELAGHEDPTELPDDDNVVNEIGRRHETVPLPEGPLVVQFEMADGPWKARLKPVPGSR
ncbi:TerD family protein [Streptomyces sp. NPDC003327]